MKIAIDARFYGPEGTGIGRYLENLLEQLSEIDKEDQFVVLLRKNNYHLFNPDSANFKKILTDASWYSAKEQVIVPAVLAKEKPDLVHFPHLNVPLLWPGRFVLTLHDLTMGQYSTGSASSRALPLFMIKKLAYKLVLNQAVKKAAKIFVPSNFVKVEVVKYFGLKEEKVKVTYEAVDELFRKVGGNNLSEGRLKQVLQTFGLKQPYLLYVGTSYPHKNLELVLKALQKLDNNLRFVLVGKRDVFQERLLEKAKELRVDDRLIYTGFVANEDLGPIYSGAEAFVFPSLSEGFGLTGLEAMAAGCPVIAAKATSLPEIYGAAALYFNPDRAGDLVSKIKMLENTAKRNELIRAGLEQVKKYSWRKLAEETLEAYRQTV